jgi:diacylglycerol O-acyltransferase-1
MTTPVSSEDTATLQQKIVALQAQLLSATHALERMKNDRGASSADHSKSAQRNGSDPSSDPTGTAPVAAPPAKSGYLFKELDRAIGWGGIKWSLRYVKLESGRISYYGSHHDTSPRYELQLRGCAVRDDGWKRNPRFKTKRNEPPPLLDTTGAYFFLFSVYHAPDAAEKEIDETEITPLLRFSTPSRAEHSSWIKLASESCAYSETDEFLADEAARATQRALQHQEALQMAQAMPGAKPGTLPPLYFAPTIKRSRSFAKLQEHHGDGMPRVNMRRTKSRDFNADKLDARSTKGYPPSKPMHRAAEPSYLSADAPIQNYRGFLNLGVIILIVSNFRLILGTIRSNGFVLTTAVKHYKNLNHLKEDPWQEFPFVSGFLLQLVFVSIAFGIEWMLCRKYFNENFGMILHHFNAHSALLIPLGIVWNLIDRPAVGAILLLHATITWMKLISYMLANEDYRLSSRRVGGNPHLATLALVENLDSDEANINYPQNVTLRNIFYFWCAPTLTYQIAFPKSPRVRYWKIADILMRMTVSIALFTFLLAQIVQPALEELVSDLDETNGSYTAAIFAEYWLKLSIANTYLWLLMFYTYFHLYLNLFAELLRFGDRVFYKDWWNSSEVSAYWRLWNMPVHYWLIRHVYFPCVRLKMPKVAATFVVFFLSAVMHEVLVSVPFHIIRPWSFIGMMMQIPLVAFTKYLYRKFPGGSFGNVLFWMTFCVIGQPMAILLYTVDYQYGKHHSTNMEIFDTDDCRFLWKNSCLIR